MRFGRPGGGAPISTYSGRKKIRTHEDPILRFQWSEDLRRCVDNTLRYKQDWQQMELYKNQLGNYHGILEHSVYCCQALVRKQRMQVIFRQRFR